MPKVTNERKGATARDRHLQERRRRQREEEGEEEVEEVDDAVDEEPNGINPRLGPSRREPRPRRRRIFIEDSSSEEERNQDITGYVSNDLFSMVIQLFQVLRGGGEDQENQQDRKVRQ